MQRCRMRRYRDCRPSECSAAECVDIAIAVASVPQTWRTKPLRVSAWLTNKLGADMSKPTIAFFLKFNVKLRGSLAACLGVAPIARGQLTFLGARSSDQG